MEKRKPDFRKVSDFVALVLKENYVVEPPVKIVDIAGNYGLSVVEADLSEHSDISGYIDTGEKKIVLNRADSHTRKAFTIAHELGHWILHRDQLTENPDDYAVFYRIPLGRLEKDPIEKEANFFAANLLLPKVFLEEYYRKRSYDLGTIAEICGVSEEVVAYRIKNEYGKLQWAR